MGIKSEIKHYIEGRLHYTLKVGAEIQVSEFDEDENETIKIVRLKQDAVMYLESGNWEVEIKE